MAESKKPRREYGDGSIYQRKSDGRFVGSFYAQDGSRKYVYGDTRAEAKKKLAEAQKQDESGTLVPVDKQTFAHYLEEWLEARKRVWEPLTYQGNAQQIRHHIIPSLGTIKLQKLTMQHVQKFINGLSDDEELASSSVRLIHQILKTALAEAVKKKLMSTNPCVGITLPRVEEREYVILTAEQSQQFLETVKGHKLEGLVTLALATALRRGELLGLQWEDVDLEEGTLQVRHNLTHTSMKRAGRQGFNNGSPKSQSGKRTIPLVPFAIDTLKEHRKRQFEQHLRASQWEERNLVFPNRRGGYQYPACVDRDFKQLITTLGLSEEMRLHDLRHSCATLLLSKGIPPNVVQKILGHAKVSTTLIIYGHVLPGGQKEAMKLYNALLTEKKAQ